MLHDTPLSCLVSPEDGGTGPLPECLTRYTGFLVAKAHQRLWGVFSQLCQRHGMEAPAPGILSLLVHHGPISQHQLGRLIRTDRTTMVKIVDSLEKQGLARRTDHPEDRRMYLVEVTEEGRRRLQGMQLEGEEMETQLLAQFSEDERKLIRRALMALAG